ncbi:carbamoyltransferase HypF [Mycolicibacterium sp. BiH015]|uniref:carbamoyltransferase HypF n=1 Tax=Mycolicibacterium sp. BiH015 TaxID=3018808 RepID=UPI0022E0236F|nr:carbamoyltransferase HypF [Mycolicibacterium sp. BiH015]MDA2895149.1 carbamoyltransferase HypF [Mycolicibacterium sp. BiH015]
MKGTPSAPEVVRVRLDITGVVQGVGFRPALARIATRHGVGGFVFNDAGSVHCELQGTQADVDAVVAGIRRDGPPMARIDGLRIADISPREDTSGFQIVGSRGGDDGRTLVPPDIAMCADCLREMRDPADRRFGHPFITCTNCGPRFTVIMDLPYDRPVTTMSGFPMCPSCAAEYADPGDRRYHAQTIACLECGPRLWWRGPAEAPDPLEAAVRALRDGMIVALKGIGGYHLACRADDAGAVTALRKRKHRPAKPFAVMVADLDAAGDVVEMAVDVGAALTSAAAPVVLAPRTGRGVVDAVAPGLRDLGVMLAYSPVHHLLFDRLGAVPLVMTSANVSGSPIVYRDADLSWIEGIADGVLGHDRPIHVPCEDSVVSIGDSGAVPVRRSRGYAPLPVDVPRGGAGPVILATGGDLKTTFALMGADGRAHMSSHMGDMADVRTQATFTAAVDHLAFMTGRRPAVVACDAHPGYATTAWAARSGIGRTMTIQHHHAHAVALLTEHDRLDTATLVVTYDGTGYGTDGTIWGGELLAVPSPDRFSRVGHLAAFALPGGDGAVRQPARIALDLLHRAGVPWDFAPAPLAAVGVHGLRILAQQIPRGVGCVPTTSMGRLFDAVAALLGVCQDVTYEGQAAVELEAIARSGRPGELRFAVHDGVMDPLPVIRELVDGVRESVSIADLAASFHHAVIEATVVAADAAARAAGIGTIGLTGGVFANRLLLDGIRNRLSDKSYDVLTHRLVPCNDGGLALGQAVIAAARLADEGSDECA